MGELKDDANVRNLQGATLRLVITSNAEEMGLAAGGKMKQKIYEDDECNLGQYNAKKVTRVFVNIANGNMWTGITGKKLPESPLNPQLYKSYGYPWFELYDDGHPSKNDVQMSDALANVKSIKEIEFDPNKPWNCPICTFENVPKKLICCMCQQGKKPMAKEEKKKETIKIDEKDKKVIDG